MTKVLVTGGAGFIGTAVVKDLLKKGYEVRTMDIIEPPIKEVETVIGSIMDINCVTQAVSGCDYVIHLAALLGVKRTEIKRLDCLNINILGTINILDACVKARVKKIVFSSSSEVYGDQVKMPITEENPINPKSIYAITKVACEEYLKAYKQNYDLNYSIVRFFNVYGPGQVAEFVMSRFIKAIMNGNSPIIYGDGNQIRAFTFVEDAVKGMILALEAKEACGEIFNIGNDKTKVSIKELAETIIKISDKKITPKFISMEDSDRDTNREIIERIPSIEKAKKILGYFPKFSLEEGIKKVMEFGKIEETWFDPMKYNQMNNNDI